MSRFFSEKLNRLVPYTPGEQPKDMKYIKLNTNESPFKPSEKEIKFASEAAENLNLYPDPECRVLTQKIADLLGVDYEEVLVTNGSDEILNFAFIAFCDNKIAGPRFERYKAAMLPQEAERVLLFPDENGKHNLLPVPDLKVYMNKEEVKK